MTLALMTSDLDILFGVSEGIRQVLPHAQILPLIHNQESVVEQLLRDGRLDAVIGAFISDTWLHRLSPKTCPLIDIARHSNITLAPSFTVDNVALGQQAARFLHQRSISHLFIASTPTNCAERERATACLHEAQSLGLLTSPWDKDAFRARPSADIPAGLYCTHDTIARHILQTLPKNTCPTHLYVVGTGNQVQENLLSPVSLTTFPLPYHEIGRSVARALISSTFTPLRFAPSPIIIRESTHSANSLIDRAQHYIAQHLDTPPDVLTLAAELNVSRRTLENHFRTDLNTAPASAWREQQINHAIALIRSTSLSIEEIALNCGFIGAPHLSQAFRKANLGTPGSHRQKP